MSTYSYTIKSGQSTILVGYLVSGGAVDIIGLLLAFTPPADIPIPSSIKGLPVKEVGGFGYSGVAGVTVPSSVLSIDSNAFVACSLMTTLVDNAAMCPSREASLFVIKPSYPASRFDSRTLRRDSPVHVEHRYAFRFRRGCPAHGFLHKTKPHRARFVWPAGGAWAVWPV